jgi:hypothetical protein
MTTKKNLSKLEQVALREAWKHEATEFTPWLAEQDNLDTLAQALGISELELVATEHWGGEGRGARGEKTVVRALAASSLPPRLGRCSTAGTTHHRERR